jgi:hypothetical protein
MTASQTSIITEDRIREIVREEIAARERVEAELDADLEREVADALDHARAMTKFIMAACRCAR